jgi:hypothetical protein
MTKPTLFYIKNFIANAIGFITVYLSPISGLLLVTGIMVLLDTIVGIYVAINLGGIKAFQNDKLFNLAVKSFFYLGTIVLAFTVDKYIIEKDLIFNIENLTSKVVTCSWLYIELKSLDEKSQKLGNKPFIAVIKDLIAIIKGLKKDINELKE